MPKQKRPFVVEIEAKLTVHAFDEDSASKKVEKAFASGGPLGIDVDAGDTSMDLRSRGPGAGVGKLSWRPNRRTAHRCAQTALRLHGQVVRFAQVSP